VLERRRASGFGSGARFANCLIAHFPIVQFNDTKDSAISALHRSIYQDIIRQAIEASRPASEVWAVTMRAQQDGALLTINFSRGTEALRSPKAMMTRTRPCSGPRVSSCGCIGQVESRRRRLMPTTS
jgi:hypothetical protein